MFFVMKIRKNIQVMYQKIVVKTKISIHSCIITFYIAEENTFAVIFHKLSAQKKY